MNKNFKKIVRNLSYALSSNFLNFFISALIVLILPKYLGVNEYGYFQLYIFYSSYLGFLQFGWNDGLYLRYAGNKIGELQKLDLKNQFNMLIISQLIFSILLFMVGIFFSNDESKKIITLCLSLSLIPIGCRAMFLFLFQTINDFKSFTKIMIFDRILYLILIVICLIFFENNFEFYIYADVVSKYISFIYSIVLGKSFFKKSSGFENYKIFVEEIKGNIIAGSILMLSNISSMLIVGISRIFIEKQWSIAIFGTISLSLNILSLAMVFITAIGNVLFPTLRGLEESKLSRIYKEISLPIELFSYLVLLFYLPVKFIFDNWFSEYKELSLYLVFILPLIIFETKTSLLINPYLKTLRKEKLLLKINLISLFFSFCFAFVAAFVLNNLLLVTFSMTLSLFFRKNYSEYKLAKILNNSFWDIFFKETIIVSLFMISILLWEVNGYYFFLLCFVLVSYFNKNIIINALKIMRKK